MHFTREPIIESILSARDGFKLVLRNSKTQGGAEISAEVVEIVSFSGAVFYRSQDRSKNFLLPASDYEINEVKDARLVLKNISIEKSNKLQNPPKEPIAHESQAGDVDLDLEMTEEDASSAAQGQGQPQPQHSSRQERRRERRRNRRRRHSEERHGEEKKDVASESGEDAQNQESSGLEQPVAPIPTLNLIPPPPTLISQTLARYKEKQPEQQASEGVESTSGSVVVEDANQQSSYQAPLEPEDLV